MAEAEILSAPMVIEYPFTRTVGPVQSAFLTGLREGIVLGVRADRRPGPRARRSSTTRSPARSSRELVEVGRHRHRHHLGVGARAPRRASRSTGPFAWALVRLDGADTALLHAVDAGRPDAVRTGMRVRVRWASRARPARSPTSPASSRYEGDPMTDPRAPPDAARASSRSRGIVARPPASTTRSPPAAPRPASCSGIAEQRIVGERCPSCRKVVRAAARRLPHLRRRRPASRSSSARPRHVTTFCIVNVKFDGPRPSRCPYVYAPHRCSTAPTSPCTACIAGDPVRPGPHGHAGRGGVGRRRRARPTSRPSSGSGRPASPTPTTRPTRSTS